MVKRSENIFDDEEEEISDGVSIDSYLQLLSNDKKTLVLKIISNKMGYITFKDGILISAKTGNLKSDDAIYEILSWKNCKYSTLEYIQPNVNEKVTKPLMYILLNFTKKMDEN